MGKKNNKNQKKEFSKVLLIQESALLWVLTLSFIGLAFYCIFCGYTGSLPWLAAMISFPWTAYGVSQVFYYKKSTVENSKDGIKFESVMAEVNAMYSNSIPQIDWGIDEEEQNINSNIVTEENLNDYIPDINYGI